MTKTVFFEDHWSPEIQIPKPFFLLFNKIKLHNNWLQIKIIWNSFCDRNHKSNFIWYKSMIKMFNTQIVRVSNKRWQPRDWRAVQPYSTTWAAWGQAGATARSDGPRGGATRSARTSSQCPAPAGTTAVVVARPHIHKCVIRFEWKLFNVYFILYDYINM